MTGRQSLGAAGAALAVGGAAAAISGGGGLALGVAGAGLILAQAILIDTKPVKTPVVMFHSVAPDLPGRPGLFPLQTPPRALESYLKYLRWRGYEAIHLDRLERHLRHDQPLPARPIVLTFDDGYLDAWVYVYPLMKRYGFKGTVFVPTDFIEPGTTVRPNLEDALEGRVEEDELEAYGYLNEEEIRRLAATDVLSIQSHGRTHTWLPVSGEIIDFHNPNLGARSLRWLWWNRFPDRKPFWFRECRHESVPWGVPVYRNELALASPALKADPALEGHLTAFVQGQGGRALFDRSDWRALLHQEVKRYRAGLPEGERMESREEFRSRLRGELTSSRLTLEGLTGRKVRFMCWPNGGTCPEAIDLLEECGYLASTVPSWASRKRRNHRGTPPSQIHRISATPVFGESPRDWPWALSFAAKVERNRGNRYMELPMKAAWLRGRLFGRRLRGRVE
jgi:peptidoglycan/xylan/chitin deacetylase (PgdA/CDA1 family)